MTVVLAAPPTRIRQQATLVGIGVDTLSRVAAPGGAAEPAPAYNRRIWQQIAGVWGWR